jgi:hypothetical protein
MRRFAVSVCKLFLIAPDLIRRFFHAFVPPHREHAITNSLVFGEERKRRRAVKPNSCDSASLYIGKKMRFARYEVRFASGGVAVPAQEVGK